MTDELRSLTDLPSLEQLVRDQDVEALLAALDEALASLPADARVTLEGGPTVGPRTLRVIRAALGLDADFLRDHPEALFQCLYNRLRWFDAPDTAPFFAPAEQGPWSDPDAHLSALAEHWRRQRDSRSPAPWLESLSPLKGELESSDQLFQGLEGAPTCAAFSPSGDRLAAGAWGEEENLRIWDMATGECLQVLEGHPEIEVLCVAWSPDGKRLVSGSRSHDVRVWDAESGELLHDFQKQEGRVAAVAFSSDGRLVAAANLGRVARLFDTTSGKQVHTLKGHKQSVLSVAFHPSGRFLATGSSDDSVRIWDVETGVQVARIKTGTSVRSLAFSPDGERLALPDDEGIVLVETREWKRLPEPLGDNTFSQVAWLGNDKLGVMGDEVEVLEVGSGEHLRSRALPRAEDEQQVAFHPDGRRIAVTGSNAGVRLIDLESEAAPTLDADGNQVIKLWISPDASLVIATDMLTHRFVDAKGRARQVRLNPMPMPQSSWVLHPEGRLLAYATLHIQESTGFWAIALLNLETLTVERTLTVDPATGTKGGWPFPPNEPPAMAFSPDGTCLAAAVEQGAVRLWRVSDGTPLHTLRGFGEDEYVTQLHFTPEGAHVVSSSESDPSPRVHDVKSGARLDGLPKGARDGSAEPQKTPALEYRAETEEGPLALVRQGERKPFVHFPLEMEEALLLRGGMVVCRGRSDMNAFYALRLHT